MNIVITMKQANQEVFRRIYKFSEDSTLEELDIFATSLRDKYFFCALYNWYEIEDSEIEAFEEI